MTYFTKELETLWKRAPNDLASDQIYLLVNAFKHETVIYQGLLRNRFEDEVKTKRACIEMEYKSILDKPKLNTPERREALIDELHEYAEMFGELQELNRTLGRLESDIGHGEQNDA